MRSGVVWLAQHTKTGERRVFKFCYDADKLRALQREITLFRMLTKALGDRDDIVRIHEWRFDEAPYFIESAYTAGGSLIDWAAAHGGLSAIALESRLEIVAQVATALAAAHSVGVLHKDVKPGNVLMAGRRGDERAQLGDFGVGAIIEKERLAAAGITAMGMTVDARTNLAATPHGTRLYMAPELLEGKPATIQADIYSLGVMLYQIVVGDLARAMGPGWERDVDDELLRADIAAAVDRDPARRLGSAAQLAERLARLAERRQEQVAIRRALAERERQRAEAEQARAALARVRARRKLMALAATALVLFSGIVTFQSLRVAREARAAEEAAQAATVAGQTAQQVSDFLVSLFEEADPYTAQGREVTAREVLDRGKDKIDSLADQPEVQATLMHVMGVVYGNIGLYQESAPLLEQAVEKRRQLHGDRHLAVADSLHALARTLENQQIFEPAEQSAREALDLRRTFLGDAHIDTAGTMEVLADVLAGSSRHRDAGPLYQKVLAIRRQHLGAEHALVARSLNRMGTLHFLMRQSKEAADWYRQALDMYRRLPGNHGPDVAVAKYYLGLAYSAQDDVATAEPLLLESMEANRALLGEDHPWVGAAMNELGFLYRRTGQYDRAEPLLRELLDLYRKSSGDASPSYAITLGHLAFIARLRGDCREADALSRKSLSIFRKALPETHFFIADSLNDRGLLLESWEDLAAAEQHYRDSLDAYERLPSEDKPYAFVVMANLAHIHVNAGRLAPADALLLRATEALRQSQSTNGWHLEHVNSVRGAYLARAGDHASAESLLLSSHQWLKAHLGAHRLYTQRALERIIGFYESQGRSDKAGTYRAGLDQARCASSM